VGKSRKKRKSVCIVGSDDYNMELIRRSVGADQWDLKSVLAWQDVQPSTGRIEFIDLYRQAKKIIDNHPEPPDAIIGYLDFPVTSLASLLNRKYGLIGASPEAVARCEHKYWMRLCQSRVMPDETPQFAATNPFSPEEASRVVPDFPFWLKPVKSHSSVLGFLVRDRGDLEAALHACRKKIHYFGEPFNEFLERLDDTSEIDGIDGNFAIAESLISTSRQFTLEGYVYRGDVTVYGAVDSHRGGVYSSSFSRYQYPAQLPDKVVKRSTRQVGKLLGIMKYDNAPFNVEFFWDPGTDDLHLLEINPRISKSHAPMFLMVDGASHHKAAIELALGKKPSMPRGKGGDALASKFMLRSFEADGIVRRVPSRQELEELSRILPAMEANILVQPNIRLSSLFYQDSYSYELAEVFLGGRDEEMIEDAYNRCCDSLEFRIQPMPQISP